MPLLYAGGHTAPETSVYRKLPEGLPWREALLSTLRARPGGQGYKFSCASPGHPDENPSATLTFKLAPDNRGDMALVYCHVCKGNQPTLAAHDLVPSDLFEYSKAADEPETSKPIERYHVYTDEEGRPAHRVKRNAGKTFQQSRWDQSSERWHSGLGGCKTYLYRLPSILTAVKNGQVIFVVEGEKDVETLERFDLSATCNPMGADAWRPEYSQYLAGAEVVVIADNDDPGRRHAKKVASSLLGTAKSVRVVTSLPGAKEGGDVTDYLLKNGGTIEELRRLAEEQSPFGDRDLATQETIASKSPQSWTFALSDFLDLDFPEARFLVEGVLPEGVTLLGGRAKAGKTYLLFGLSVALACDLEPFSENWDG
ncbi:MAG: hypothetical protein HKN29_01960 [Rhodothermales bacterium]|nr:hypothetical protein [Rhodothermales bacterium]